MLIQMIRRAMRGGAMFLTTLTALFLAQPVQASTIGVAQLGGYVHDSTGLISQLSAGSPGYSASFDSNGFGTFSWTFTNLGSSVLTNVRFILFLDADIDRPGNTAFNEYGEVGLQALPPGAPANALVWSGFQIDEPGFVFGSIYNNALAGTLDNTNHVPFGAADDVSLALLFAVPNVGAGQTFTMYFQIAPTNIGGLRHFDPDSNFGFYLNGHGTGPADGPDDTGSTIPEPGTAAMLAIALGGCLAARRWRNRTKAILPIALAVLAMSPTAQAQMVLTPQGLQAGYRLTQFADGFPSIGGVGPIGIEFPNSGGVLVSDYPGGVRRFTTNADGQRAGSFAVAQNYGGRNGAGMAKSGGKIYMAQQVAGKLVQLNDDGTLNQEIASGLDLATAVATNPINGHLFVSDINTRIWDIDPIAKTKTVFKAGGFDGLTVSADGTVLYGESGDRILGFRVSDAVQIFDSGVIPGADGCAIGTGSLSNSLFVLSTAGTVTQVNIQTKAQTLLATGGSRGDLVTVDPSNGTLLLTLTDRIMRLTPPAGGGFGATPPAISNVTTRFKDASVDVIWAAPTGLAAGTTVSGYRVYRRTGASPFALVQGGLTTTNFTDNALANGTVYYYVIRWIDNRGVESGDSTEASATPTSAASRAALNTPPTILSNPVVLATAGAPYTYAVRASDPDGGDAIAYTLPTAPTGMTISSTGAIAWTPTAAQSGNVTVKVAATDRKGNFASQQFTVLVRTAAPTAPPVISSSPVTAATAGQLYAYQVIATDSNPGAVLTYSLTAAPSGVIIASNSGLVQWVPGDAQVGAGQSVTVRVQNQFGLSATQTYNITVAAAPILFPSITSTPVLSAVATQAYSYQVTATDPNPNQTLTFSLLAAPQGMTIQSATGLIQWTPALSQLGAQNVNVQVIDTLGRTATQLFTVQVTMPVLPPSVTINSPATSSVITEVTNITGTISDPNPGGAGGPISWRLEILKPTENTYRTLATGTGTIANAVVGQFDPTLLRNDTYTVRLTASKGTFEAASIASYSVAGDLKLGNFSVQFTDLSIPVAGIPISISRRYDSLDTSKGEFGAGWRLALPGQVTDSAKGQAYTTLTRVYVTRPDGRRVGFTFSPTYSGTFLAVWFPNFQADPGVTDKLTVPITSLFNSGGAFFEFAPYNPTLFTLTTKEGIKYEIDKVTGLKKITDASGNTVTVTPAGLISSTGVSVAFERDAQNRITKITEPGANPGTLRYSYDATGNLIGFTDQLSNQTQYGYENATFPNYLTKIQDPLGRSVIRNVYNAAGQIVGQCDANGNPATLAGCATFAPNPGGKLQTVVNARGFKTDLFLDARGNVLRERRWLDGSNFLDTIRTYDANGNTLTETDPAGNQKTNTYDAASNKLTEKNPLGHVTTYTYNACNKVLTQKDPAGNTTTYTYDATNCNLLRFVKDALNAVTEYRYNSRGQQSDFIDAVGSRWQWAYNAAGFVQSVTDPFGKATSFTFSPAGDLLTRIDRNNRRIDFQYDSAHRLARETWDTVPPRVTNYAYNAAGQLTSAADPDSALALAYLNTGKLLSVDNNSTPGVPRVLMTYGYDGNGNVTSVSDSLGGLTAYGYDALDRLSRVTQSGTGVNPKRVDYQYDNASFLTKLSRFSDLAGTQGVINTTFETDCNGCPGRTTAIRHRKASDNSVVHDLTFNHDVVGNITSSIDAEGFHSYSYDKVWQLLTATHAQPSLQPNEIYSYDAAENRLSSHLNATYQYSYQVNSGNRLTGTLRSSYQYDNEGNLMRQTERSSGDYVEFSYDHRNRLIASAGRSTNGAPRPVSRYTYDSFNRRIQAAENGSVAAFAYDGANPVLKTMVSGSINRRLYSRSIDEPLADDINAQARWLLADQIGTTRDVTDAGGRSLDHYRYDSFGQVLPVTNTSVVSDLTFTGRESSSPGLYYFRARWYDATIGRFISEDPLLPYSYAYAEGNPISFVDPQGEGLIDDALVRIRAFAARPAVRNAAVCFQLVLAVTSAVVDVNNVLNGDPVSQIERDIDALEDSAGCVSKRIPRRGRGNGKRRMPRPK
jgi:RHS repeat-associated protein